MIYITVKLFGKNGICGEFKDYETKALNIFKKYGGEVVVAYAPLSEKGQQDRPDEIQVLKIASLLDFEKFMKDPERTQLAAEREAVIRKTEVFLSGELISY